MRAGRQRHSVRRCICSNALRLGVACPAQQTPHADCTPLKSAPACQRAAGLALHCQAGGMWSVVGAHSCMHTWTQGRVLDALSLVKPGSQFSYQPLRGRPGLQAVREANVAPTHETLCLPGAGVFEQYLTLPPQPAPNFTVTPAATVLGNDYNCTGSQDPNAGTMPICRDYGTVEVWAPLVVCNCRLQSLTLPPDPAKRNWGFYTRFWNITVMCLLYTA